MMRDFMTVLVRVAICFWVAGSVFIGVAAYRQAKRADVREAMRERAKGNSEIANRGRRITGIDLTTKPGA